MLSKILHDKYFLSYLGFTVFFKMYSFDAPRGRAQRATLVREAVTDPNAARRQWGALPH